VSQSRGLVAVRILRDPIRRVCEGGELVSSPEPGAQSGSAEMWWLFGVAVLTSFAFGKPAESA
jgi:hypothetical protein